MRLPFLKLAFYMDTREPVHLNTVHVACKDYFTCVNHFAICLRKGARRVWTNLSLRILKSEHIKWNKATN